MKKHICIISLMIFIGLSSCESDKLDVLCYGSINGTVLDGETYQPVSGVMISTVPASVVMLSDAEGKFTIPKVLKGDVVLSLKKKDYLSNSMTIAVYDGETTPVDFLIYKDVEDIGDVLVYDPVPGNGAVDQKLNITLSWKVDVESTSAELTYNVYIFESNSTVQKLLGEDISDKEVTVSGLKTGTTYYWYVVVKYDGNKIGYSPTWTFKTTDE